MRNPALRLASAFAALVLTATVSSAQVTEVRGRVFDALTGESCRMSTLSLVQEKTAP